MYCEVVQQRDWFDEGRPAPGKKRVERVATEGTRKHLETMLRGKPGLKKGVREVRGLQSSTDGPGKDPKLSSVNRRQHSHEEAPGIVLTHLRRGGKVDEKKEGCNAVPHSLVPKVLAKE